jgi:hypothetical protein
MAETHPSRLATVWRLIVRTTIVVLALLLASLLYLWYSMQPRPNYNTLAIGPRARADVHSPVEIDIQAPEELDGKTRQEVFQLRRAAVNLHRELYAGPYEPSSTVFGQIMDGRPWWGMTGQFFYGSGQNSPAGPSEESRFILNPYLLVAAEFYGLSIWGDDHFWNLERVNSEALASSDFPFQCTHESLRWWPGEARGEVTYDVTHFLAQLKPWTARAPALADASVDITTYNARDLNLNYIQLIPAQSSHIHPTKPFDGPIGIPEFIHLGNSCGYPGGCNNGSPYVAQFADIGLDALPAQATFYLWKDKPLPSTRPDMTFVLHFQ